MDTTWPSTAAGCPAALSSLTMPLVARSSARANRGRRSHHNVAQKSGDLYNLTSLKSLLRELRVYMWQNQCEV